MRARRATGVAVRRPNGGWRACSSLRSDLRSSGRRARSARLTIASGSTPASSSAKKGALSRGVADQARQGVEDRNLALFGVPDLLAVVVGTPGLRHRPLYPRGIATRGRRRVEVHHSEVARGMTTA